MDISYKSKTIEKICCDTKKMSSFFKNDKDLIDGLQTLMTFFELEDNIFNFKTFSQYKGYNFEKCQGYKNRYSIRIIPKKLKSQYRMYLEPKQNGIEIMILKIDQHSYKNL